MTDARFRSSLFCARSDILGGVSYARTLIFLEAYPLYSREVHP